MITYPKLEQERFLPYLPIIRHLSSYHVTHFEVLMLHSIKHK